jgi:xylulokinase
VTASALVMGIDLGTTGVKAVLVEASSGNTVGQAYRSYPSVTGEGGRHEQNPDDWWNACAAVTQEALGAVPQPRVVAVGLSGHMHGVVLVDAQDNYVRPAMTWADRRDVDEVAHLRDVAGDRFSQRCANPVVEAFTAPKVAWLAKHEPRSLSQAARLVQPKDSLRHRLTGVWGSDVSDARGTLLYDVHTDAWDAELWELCGASRELAPSVSRSTEVVGRVTEAAAAATGLPAGTPVVAGAGDVACSALGAGVIETGAVYVNAGTAAQVTTPLTTPAPGSHFVFGRADSDGFHAMASVYAAGMSVDWAARTIVGPTVPAERSARHLDEMARDRPAGASGAVFVPHLLGTSVPTHDPRVRGAVLGMSPDHTPETVARAVLEGVAYACAEAARHVASISSSSMTRLHVGGGLSHSAVWCEAIAAVVNAPVYRLVGDASARGAAMVAGIGVGLWSGPAEAAAACLRVEEVPAPSATDLTAYRGGHARYQIAVESLIDLGRRIAEDQHSERSGTCR